MNPTSRPQTSQHRGDPPQSARRHAERALEVALSLWSNGHLVTAAWAATGLSRRGIRPRDMEVLKLARSIVHANGGSIRPGDVERLMAQMRRKGGQR
jgi:hypothetical protein